MKNLEQVIEKIYIGESLSVNPNWLKSKSELLTPEIGYMVSIYPELEEKHKFSGLQISDIEKIVNNFLVNVGANLLENTHFLGAWINEGYLYLDVSVNLFNIKAAIISGVKHNQKSIFDVENGKDIFLPEIQKHGTITQQNAYINQIAERYEKTGGFYEELKQYKPKDLKQARDLSSFLSSKITLLESEVRGVNSDPNNSKRLVYYVVTKRTPDGLITGFDFNSLDINSIAATWNSVKYRGYQLV